MVVDGGGWSSAAGAGGIERFHNALVNNRSQRHCMCVCNLATANNRNCTTNAIIG